MLLIATFAVSCSKHEPSKPAEKTLYTCSMHPQVVQDHPGACPICGMKLVPVRKESASAGEDRKKTGGKVKYYKSTMLLGEISQTPRKDSMGMDMVPVYEGEEETNAITVDPATVPNREVRPAIVTEGPVRRVIRTVGVVDFDETALTDVTTKFKGWIEKLYVDSTGQQVHRGEPLFDIYSPELYSAQVDRPDGAQSADESGGAGAEALKASALAKLKSSIFPSEQIAESRRRAAKKSLRINAPRDGIVVEKMVVEGQMVEAGMKLYRLADLGTVWVQSQIYEQDLPLVRSGRRPPSACPTCRTASSAGASPISIRRWMRRRARPGADGVSQPRLFPQAGDVRHG